MRWQGTSEERELTKGHAAEIEDGIPKREDNAGKS